MSKLTTLVNNFSVQNKLLRGRPRLVRMTIGVGVSASILAKAAIVSILIIGRFVFFYIFGHMSVFLY